MSYLTQSAISQSASLFGRVAQAAASEGEQAPDTWTGTNARLWAAAPGWDAAWESAVVTHPEPEYDPGQDEGVITDGMILSQVQAMRPGVSPA
jgi:hypothetical protein